MIHERSQKHDLAEKVKEMGVVSGRGKKAEGGEK